MKILVTGFDPFGSATINSSMEAVKQLPDEIGGAKILKLQIPTVCYRSLEKIEEIIKKEEVDVILSIGQAQGRSAITIERIGINIDDYSLKDNAGNQRIDEPIFEDGPDAYFVNVPIKAMMHSILQRGIPAAISNTAGTFVCNHVTYGVRHLIETKYPGKQSGFIHVPCLLEQAAIRPNVPSMSVATIVEGITAAIEAIIETKEDHKLSAGTTH